jgi:hypothetical protein
MTIRAKLVAIVIAVIAGGACSQADPTGAETRESNLRPSFDGGWTGSGTRTEEPNGSAEPTSSGLMTDTTGIVSGPGWTGSGT